MNKNKLIGTFVQLNTENYDINLITTYVEYCIEHNIISYCDKLVHHHILPKSVGFFPEFKNLTIHKWNGVYLTYEDHAYAHKLLYEATKYYKMAYAYINTLISLDNHNCPEFETIRLDSWNEWANSINCHGIRNIDAAIKKGVLTKQNTILSNGLTIAQDIGRRCRKWQMQEITLPNGTISTNQKEVVKRSIITKQNKLNSKGENIFEQHAILMKKLLSKNVKNDIGENTTIGKMRMEHASKILAKDLDTKIVSYNGVNMTLREMKSVKMKEIKNKGKQQYLIYGYGAPNEAMFLSDIKKISRALLRTSVCNPLGSSTRSRTALKKYNKLHMIGWYIQKVPNVFAIDNDS